MVQGGPQAHHHFRRRTGSEVTAIRPEFSTRQRMTLATLVSGACFQFPRVKRQVLAYLQLHSVDLSQKPGCREVIVRRIRLYLAQMSHLVLKIADPLEARFELLVTRNHGASVLISTIPRRPPPRFTCQNSTAACSSGHAARCRTQNTLAPKCACAAAWSKSREASPLRWDASNVSAITRNTSTSCGSSLSVTNDPNTTNRAK